MTCLNISTTGINTSNNPIRQLIYTYTWFMYMPCVEIL